MGPYSQGTVATDPRHSHSIELELHDLNQLFNSMDPSPFNAKDLDHDAEEFIVSWAQEYPLKRSLLRCHQNQRPRHPIAVLASLLGCGSRRFRMVLILRLTAASLETLRQR